MSRDLDFYIKLGIVFLLVLWTWQVGTHLETPYPETLVELYATPVTRIGLLLLVAATASWNTYAGIFAALAFIFLGADISVFGSAP
jgi:hypothetical protein